MKLVLQAASPVEVTLSRWKSPEEIEIIGPTPHPPGARLDMTLARDDGESHAVRMKVYRCKRRQDGLFEVAGRAMDLRKTARQALDEEAQSLPETR